MVDWKRRDYYRRQHHARFVRYVEEHGLVCQECRGEGGYTEYLIDGMGPFYECGFCEGEGRTTPYLRGYWLRWKKEEKRERVMA